MLTKILKLKHWQLFLLIFTLPFITQIGMIIYMSVLFSDTQRAFQLLESDYFNNLIVLMWVISAIPQIIKFLWFWAIATHMHSKVPSSLQLNLHLVKAAFFVLIILAMAFFTVAMLLLLDDSFWMIDYFNSLIESDVLIVMLVICVQLIGFIAMLYILYFTGKTIRLAEEQTPIKFESFIAYIALLFFPIVGVWIIQPKVNELMANHQNPKM